jgi:TPR repeat protein
MKTKESPLFFSYARADSDFALKLAKSLRSAGANLWIDQLDIQAGDHWDRTVERALEKAEGMLVILSPAAVDSKNVIDEVSFALDENKRIVPVLYQTCRIPFRLRRVQHVDFTVDFSQGLERLLSALGLRGSSEEPQTTQPVPAERLARPDRQASLMAAVPGKETVKSTALVPEPAEEKVPEITPPLIAETDYATAEKLKEQKNYGEAAQWYQKAAEQGFAAAQYELASLYYYGLGVAKSEAEAVKWYSKAAHQGHVAARDALLDVRLAVPPTKPPADQPAEMQTASSTDNTTAAALSNASGPVRETIHKIPKSLPPPKPLFEILAAQSKIISGFVVMALIVALGYLVEVFPPLTSTTGNSKAPVLQKTSDVTASPIAPSAKPDKSGSESPGGPVVKDKKGNVATPAPAESKYYVIAMTSDSEEDIRREIDRVKKMPRNIRTFSHDFPDIQPYRPGEGYQFTLLISTHALPEEEALALINKAKAAGFRNDTWKWRSDNEYFAAINNQ